MRTEIDIPEAVAKELLARIEFTLKGIGETETESEDGWWETSDGAIFGHSRLEEIRDLFKVKKLT